MDSIKEQQITRSLKLLRDGFKNELKDFIHSDPRFTELMMNLTEEFVEQNIPLVEDEHQHDMALMLMETIAVQAF